MQKYMIIATALFFGALGYYLGYSGEQHSHIQSLQKYAQCLNDHRQVSYSDESARLLAKDVAQCYIDSFSEGVPGR